MSCVCYMLYFSFYLTRLCLIYMIPLTCLYYVVYIIQYIALYI